MSSILEYLRTYGPIIGLLTAGAIIGLLAGATAQGIRNAKARQARDQEILASYRRPVGPQRPQGRHDPPPTTTPAAPDARLGR